MRLNSAELLEAEDAKGSKKELYNEGNISD